MAELIEDKASPQVSFLASAPLDLLLAMALLPMVDHFEGLDEWLRDARSSLPADLRREFALLTGFPGRHLRFVEAMAGQLLRSPAQAQDSFSAFYTQLAALSPADFQDLAMQALRKGAPEEAVDPAALLPDPQQITAYLSSRQLHVEGTQAAALIVDPQGLKQRFLNALGHFWEELYQPAFAEQWPIMERSAAYHRDQSYPPHLGELFLAVTGRVLPPEVQLRQETIHEVRFVPSCHLGPYVAFFQNDDLLTVFYNARSSLLEERRASEQVRQLYPILKALADETRLQILLLLREREISAQEIVDQLGLPQPAISRHLELMVTAGLLQVRPEGRAEYYAPNREAWQRLVNDLRTLL